MTSTAFVPSTPLLRRNSIYHQLHPLSSTIPQLSYYVPGKPYACLQPPAESTKPVNALPSDEASVPFISPVQLAIVLEGTMLADELLAQVFISSRDGFSNEKFFDTLIPLGGVPSLVFGRTEAGVLFGGYSSYGFYGRDDYREATTSRSMYVFKIDAGEVLFADNTDPIHYDFYDYAIRFGAAMLGIPMNPEKHILKSNMATSSCRLPNGETSVLGDATLAKIDSLGVWVAKKYVIENKEENNKPRGLFSRFFGSA